MQFTLTESNWPKNSMLQRLALSWVEKIIKLPEKEATYIVYMFLTLNT